MTENSSNIEIEIPLLPMQKAFLRSEAKFLAVVSSRAQGKTFVAVLQALLCLLDGQNVVYGVQNLDAWRKGGEQHLKTFLRKLGIEDRWKFNKSTYTGYLQTTWGEAALYIFTYESEDSIRGATEISMAVLDEFVLSSPRIMASLTPVLRGHDLRGRVIRPRIRAVSTPNMNSEWQLMLIEHDKHGIELLRANPNDNIYVTEEQRALMAASIFDEKLRRQECLGEIILGDNSTSMLSLNDFSDQPKMSSSSNDLIWAGLDMAHTGDRDRHVFCAIKGDKELVALHDFGVADSTDVATWIKKFNKVFRINSLNVDLAWSQSVYDQLKYEIPCTQIPFGGKAEDSDTYANIRAEMYFRGARLVKDEGLYLYTYDKNQFVDESLVIELKREMTNIHWLQNTSNKLQIEPKTDVRIRIGKSPDVSDAYCLAAHQVPRKEPLINSKLNPTEDPLLKEALAEIMDDD